MSEVVINPNGGTLQMLGARENSNDSYNEGSQNLGAKC